MSSKKDKWQSYITILIFCILIFCFTLATIIVPSKEFSETENRYLAQRPKLELESIINGKFENDYEEYLTDQFVLRDSLVGLKTTTQKMLFKREIKDIYFADDDYLIERHTESFNSDIAQRNIRVLSQFAKKYQEQFGTEHISIMIIPNAVDILKDKLPPFASSYNEEEYLKQIAKSLPENVWFDTAKILQGHNNEELYYRTDHHWKTLSAFYVYQEWAKMQGYNVPEITDYEIKTVTSNFEGTIQSKLGIKTTTDTMELFLPKEKIGYTIYNEISKETSNSLYDYSKLDTKDKYAIYFSGNQPFIRINTEVGNGRKILVIKDSYANCFVPFMIGEFQEIDVVDIRYTNQKLSELMKAEEYTDLLVLYNTSGFAEDISITKLTN
ncbi:MAG: DHHW family protein [Clostridia bacterium]|nr:DHHW family protein [Clostridia bacterium]